MGETRKMAQRKREPERFEMMVRMIGFEPILC